MEVQYVNKLCPVCKGYVIINELGDEMCESCRYTLPTYTHVETSVPSTSETCKRCGTILEHDGDWKVCPRCHYGSIITAGDPPEYPYWKADGEAHAWGKLDPDLSPQTLTITNCDKFKVQLREIDIEFELDPDKLENIDTLIINGYKYRKEK